MGGATVGELLIAASIKTEQALDLVRDVAAMVARCRGHMHRAPTQEANEALTAVATLKRCLGPLADVAREIGTPAVGSREDAQGGAS